MRLLHPTTTLQGILLLTMPTATSIMLGGNPIEAGICMAEMYQTDYSSYGLDGLLNVTSDLGYCTQIAGIDTLTDYLGEMSTYSSEIGQSLWYLE